MNNPILDYCPPFPKARLSLPPFEVFLAAALLAAFVWLICPPEGGANDLRDPAFSIKTTLATLRVQIERYQLDHAGHPPVQGRLLEQLSSATDGMGNVVPDGTPGSFGPYVAQMPVNPYNAQSAVSARPSRTSGWVYTVHGRDYSLQAVNTTGTGVLSY
jgi:hypothetical protein